jgi:hypothetical protein
VPLTAGVAISVVVVVVVVNGAEEEISDKADMKYKTSKFR